MAEQAMTHEGLQQRIRELNDELKTVKTERDALKKALAQRDPKKLEAADEIYQAKQNDSRYRV